MRSIHSTLEIGFDLDGILSHTDADALAWFQARGLVGPEVTAAQVDRWQFQDCLGVSDEAVSEMFADPEFWTNLTPDYQGINVLCQLVERGAVIHIATHRGCREITADWLRRHGCDYQHLEFLNPEEKVRYAEMKQLDYFFEDHPKTGLHLASAVGKLSFLRDKPYNRKIGTSKYMHRFYQWAEIEEFFCLNLI